MSITSRADYRAALKEFIRLNKADTNTGSGTAWEDLWYGTGDPGAGTIGNTTNGAVPTSSTTGAPKINFGTGRGYLTRVEFGKQTQQGGRLMLYDRLYHFGTITNSTALFSPTAPSYSSRVPGGTDFTGLQLWIECRASTSGTPTATVTYTDQSGNAGHSTSGSVLASVNACQQLPLAAGDCGIQKIESIQLAAATYSVDVFIARPLWMGYVPLFGRDELLHGLGETKLPEVWQTSCLALMQNPSGSRFAGVHVVECEIASK